ncbi:unnamed protein product [Leptidea sinapis]|uniref:Uncharacterized protein n=1 Tax=Leptidea sinapis TaxID=189913 RepID=A0A5E4Q1X0_9NEOP|nr:unnamed protein product [Leptidea sinapis]
MRAIEKYKKSPPAITRKIDEIFDSALIDAEDYRRTPYWILNIIKLKHKRDQNNEIQNILAERGRQFNKKKYTRINNYDNHLRKRRVAINNSTDDITNKTSVETNGNDTDKVKDVTVATTDYPDTTTSNKSLDMTTATPTRRSLSLNVLKFNLISNINGMLSEIKSKIELFTFVKQKYGDDILFKMGYLSGSLDALKYFVDILQNGIRDKVWNETNIYQVYETAEKIKFILDKLITMLNAYINEIFNIDE